MNQQNQITAHVVTLNGTSTPQCNCGSGQRETGMISVTSPFQQHLGYCPACESEKRRRYNLQ